MRNHDLVNGKASDTVSVVICNFNKVDLLLKCLQSISHQTYKNIEIILVDNNSLDGSVEKVSDIYPSVKIIKSKINLGFAQGNNQGVGIASGKFIFLLNNDTELFENAIETLVKTYIPKALLSACQIATYDRTIQRTGAGVDIFGYPFQETELQKTRIFYADGAALFMKKKDFIDIGGFDSRLFMFQEDIDLSWRARLMGYSILPCWDAKLFHVFGGTAKASIGFDKSYNTSLFRRYHNEKNIIRNILKNYSAISLCGIIPTLLFFHFFEMLFLLVTGRLRVIKCYISAYLWNISNLKDTIIRRRIVQSKRTVPDYQIFKNMYFTYSKFLTLIRLGVPNFR
jgi:GT2 family glycosyltransferase